MNGSLKKSARTLYGVCTCIIVLMVICYFGVSNTKGTYSTNILNCPSGYTNFLNNNNYCYKCKSGELAQVNGEIKCVTTTGSTSVSCYISTNSKGENDANTCKDKGIDNVSDCDVTNVQVSGAASKVSYLCYEEGSKQYSEPLKTNVLVSEDLPYCTSIYNECGKDIVYRDTSESKYTCTSTDSDGNKKEFCYNKAGGTRKCLLQINIAETSERTYYKYTLTSCGTSTPVGGNNGETGTTTPSSSSSSKTSSSSSLTGPGSPTPSSNVDDNPKTGSVAIFMVWVIALGTLIYSFVYFKQSKFE